MRRVIRYYFYSYCIVIEQLSNRTPRVDMCTLCAHNTIVSTTFTFYNDAVHATLYTKTSSKRKVPGPDRTEYDCYAHVANK